MHIGKSIEPAWQFSLALMLVFFVFGSVQAGELHVSAFGQPNQGASNAGAGALPRNWDDTWHATPGLSWRTGGPWTFYTGVGYDIDPTTAGDRTADMPVDQQWRMSGGTTYQFAGGSKLGIGVTYADYGDAEIDNGGTRPVSGLP